MAVAVVNSTAAFAVGPSPTAASSALAMTTGNCIVAAFRSGLNGRNISTVTDTAGNTYTRVAANGVPDGPATVLEVWVATNITGHASNVVTGTFAVGDGSNYSIAVAQLSGVAVSGVIIRSAGGNTEPSGVSISVAPSFVTTRDSIVVAVTQVNATGSTWTAGSGFTTIVQDGSQVTYMEGAIVGGSDTVVTPAASSSNGAAKNIVWVELLEPSSSGGGGGGAFTFLGI